MQYRSAFFLASIFFLQASCYGSPLSGYEPQKPHFLFVGTGYSSEQVAPGLYQIQFHGSVSLNPVIAKRYLMYRAAQIGVQKKKHFFTLYQSISHAVSNQPCDEPSFYYNSIDGEHHPLAYGYVYFHNDRQLKDFSVSLVYRKYQEAKKTNQE